MCVHVEPRWVVISDARDKAAAVLLRRASTFTLIAISSAAGRAERMARLHRATLGGDTAADGGGSSSSGDALAAATPPPQPCGPCL